MRLPLRLSLVLVVLVLMVLVLVVLRVFFFPLTRSEDGFVFVLCFFFVTEVTLGNVPQEEYSLDDSDDTGEFLLRFFFDRLNFMTFPKKPFRHVRFLSRPRFRRSFTSPPLVAVNNDGCLKIERVASL